jgi:hypothetical protein
MSPLRNWDSSNPYPASECAPTPPEPKGGGHTRLGGGGGGGPIPTTGEKAKHSAYSVCSPDGVTRLGDQNARVHTGHQEGVSRGPKAQP